jgi:NAD(P)H-dependent FMN reductase
MTTASAIDETEGIQTFDRLIERCDGRIFMTPNYNHDYPGFWKMRSACI